MTNTRILDIAKERFRKASSSQETEEILPTRGRLRRRIIQEESSGINSKLLRSWWMPYDKNLCIICQKNNVHKMHKVSYIDIGDKMLATARRLEDISFHLRLTWYQIAITLQQRTFGITFLVGYMSRERLESLIRINSKIWRKRVVINIQ